jgi:hypothetical protein
MTSVLLRRFVVPVFCETVTVWAGEREQGRRAEAW